MTGQLQVGLDPSPAEYVAGPGPPFQADPNDPGLFSTRPSHLRTRPHRVAIGSRGRHPRSIKLDVTAADRLECGFKLLNPLVARQFELSMGVGLPRDPPQPPTIVPSADETELVVERHEILTLKRLANCLGGFRGDRCQCGHSLAQGRPPNHPHFLVDRQSNRADRGLGPGYGVRRDRLWCQ